MVEKFKLILQLVYIQFQILFNTELYFRPAFSGMNNHKPLPIRTNLLGVWTLSLFNLFLYIFFA